MVEARGAAQELGEPAARGFDGSGGWNWAAKALAADETVLVRASGSLGPSDTMARMAPFGALDASLWASPKE